MSTVDASLSRDALGAGAAGKRRRGVRFGDQSMRAGLAVLVPMLVLALVGRLFLIDPNEQDLAAAFQPPGSSGHLLGTDALGRDVLAWTAGGIATGCLVSLAVVTISAVVGTAVALVAGYFGSWVDAGLMRLVDLQLAVPPLLIFIAASAVVRPTLPILILLLSSVGWVPYARVVRTQVVSDRERGYVAAARLAGASHLGVMVRHLLPGVATIVMVYGSLQAGFVLLWESGLSFVGLGVQPPSPSLGFLIAAGRDQLAQAWWIVTIPGLAIVLLVLAFNLIGDGLRDRYGLDEGEAAAR